MPLPPAECKVYTPPSLAEAMVSAIHCGRDAEWLDPCVGPGAFVSALRARKVRKDRIVALDLESAPGKFDSFARTVRGVDFFRWMRSTTARFDKIIANPPYVPIERLSRALQKPILSLNEIDSASFRLNSNYWCAFLAGSLRMLKDGGDLAFVLPAAWEYADYAEAVKQHIFDAFCSVEVHRCLKPLFETVSEGCVVLVARGYGTRKGQTAYFEYLAPDELIKSLTGKKKEPVKYRQTSSVQTELKDAVKLGDVFDVGIGCVTGDGKFFLLTEEQRLEHSLPHDAVTPIVSKARHLKSAFLRSGDWHRLLAAGERVWLFKPSKRAQQSRTVQRYLEHGENMCDLKRHKLRIREHWWDVPMVEPCDGFLSGMAKTGPWISFRSMQDLSASNTLYVVRVLERMRQEEKVSDYIRDHRERARAEMRFFEIQRSSSAAIRKAALCKLPSGKRHPHQRRISGALLEQIEGKLQGIGSKLARVGDFAALHRIVAEEIGGMKGIGALTVYDIAHRIGAHFRKAPEHVYLHAGTKAGARVFNIRGDFFDPKVLPKAFSRLAPYEIEDCLCIYKDELRGSKSCLVRRPGCG